MEEELRERGSRADFKGERDDILFPFNDADCSAGEA